MKFEEALKELETLVRQMETGGMSLDDMIKAYERGQNLLATCQKELTNVKARIEKVTKQGAVEGLVA